VSKPKKFRKLTAVEVACYDFNAMISTLEEHFSVEEVAEVLECVKAKLEAVIVRKENHG
jgi:hypothetical protein